MGAENNIANHWQLKKLKEVSEINPKLPKKEEIPTDLEVQFLPMKLVEEIVNKIHLSETRKFNEVLKGSYTPFVNGDVIFAKVTPCMENGKIAVVKNLKNGIGFGSSEFHVIRPKENILSDYIFYFLVQDKFRNQAQHEMTGAVGLRRVPKQFIENYFIPLPPIPEQHTIVSKIEELFSELDNGKQQLLTAQQQLKVYRQSLLKWAFEGKLSLNHDSPDLHDGHDLKKEKNQGNHINPKNQGADKSELPEGWKKVKIEDIATVGTGATPLKGNSKYYDKGKIAWVTSGALNEEFVKEATDYVTDLALKETNLSVYPKHTLLLAMYGEGKTRGKCSELLIEAATNQAIAAIHFKNHDERVRPFLKYFLLKNYNDIRRLSSGGVQPNLNLGIVKKTIIPFPTLLEQQLIVSELESKLTVCDKIEETIAQSLQQAETLRQSILKKAFEGKLVAALKKHPTLLEESALCEEAVQAPKGRDTQTMGTAHRNESRVSSKALKGRNNLNLKK